MSDIKDPRVLFAAERTLLAWNRTSLALIAFGFLLERSGLLLQLLEKTPLESVTMGLAFWVGAAFIALGAFTAIYSARQYAVVLKTLTPVEFPPGYGGKWGMVINAVIAILGFALVIGVFLDHVR